MFVFIVSRSKTLESKMSVSEDYIRLLILFGLPVALVSRPPSQAPTITTSSSFQVMVDLDAKLAATPWV